MNHIAENALIAGVFLMIFILPFYLALTRIKKAIKSKFTQLLHKTAQQHRLTVNRTEFLGHRLLGWTDSCILICIETLDSEPFMVDMHNIKSCRLLKPEQNKTVQSVGLVFEPNAGTPINLLLYKQFDDNEMHLKNIEKKARDWELLLNKHLLAAASAKA